MKPQRPAPDQLSLSPRVPRIDLEPLALTDPATPVRFVVCPVCVNNPDGVWSTLHSRWRPCSVCDGQGQIGGGE